MRLRVCRTAAVAMALSACAGDNPENVPEYGQWNLNTELVSVTIDGQMVPASDFSEQILSVENPQKLCGEPMFIDLEWQETDINRKVHGSCKFDRYDVTQSRVSGAGSCANIAPEVDFNPEFDLSIAQAPDSYRMRLTMKGMAKLPSGQSHFVSALAVQEGTRLGDC